eukprot:m51a1_g12032 hypothetical protein (155) ;mRNA; f:4237-5935
MLAILQSAKGKVLVINKAYNLNDQMAMCATPQQRARGEAVRAATARIVRSELWKAGEEEHRVATGLTGEEARALGELLAAAPPSSEELDLARSLGELGGTVGPRDRAIALGLIRLASLARETLGDAAFDRLLSALVPMMLCDGEAGSCGCGSRP